MREPLYGYRDLSELPVRKGDLVRFPAGTLVREGNELHVLTRAQTVRVGRLNQGYSLRVGVYYGDPDRFVLEFENSLDGHLCEKQYGTRDLSLSSGLSFGEGNPPAESSICTSR